MGLTCKQLAQAWGIAVTKVTQAREPTFRKMARAMLMFPTETMEELSQVMHSEQEKNSPRASCDDAVLEREIFLRESMLDNKRLERETVHPVRSHEATEPRRHGGTNGQATKNHC